MQLTFTDFLIILSGSSPKTAASTSPAAANLTIRIGAVVLLSIGIAFIGGTLMAHRFLLLDDTQGDWMVAISYGFGWAIVVGVLDQLLMAAMDAVPRYGFRYWAGIGSRFGIALLIGILPAQEITYKLWDKSIEYSAKTLELEARQQDKQKIADLHDLGVTEKLVDSAKGRVDGLAAQLRTLPPDIRNKLEGSRRCDETLKILRDKQRAILTDANASPTMVVNYATQVQNKTSQCKTVRNDAYTAKRRYVEGIENDLATAKDQKNAVEARHLTATTEAAEETRQQATAAEAAFASGGGRGAALKHVIETVPEAGIMILVVRCLILVFELAPFAIKTMVENPVSENARQQILSEANSYKVAAALADRITQESLREAKTSTELADIARSTMLAAAQTQAYVMQPLKDYHAMCATIIAEQSVHETLSRRAGHDMAAQIAEGYLIASQEAYRRLAESTINSSQRAAGAAA